MNSDFFSAFYAKKAGYEDKYKRILFIRFAFCSGIEGGFHWMQNIFYSFNRFWFARDTSICFAGFSKVLEKKKTKRKKKSCHVNVSPENKQTEEPRSLPLCCSADISPFTQVVRTCCSWTCCSCRWKAKAKFPSTRVLSKKDICFLYTY